MSDTKTGLVVSEAFGSREIARSAETAASAAAAQATAMIQARYVVALQRPRDMDNVRVKLLKACERPGFAEDAWYRKPVGKGVEGLTIRFAEEASRCMGNVSKDAMVLYEDDDTRIVRLVVTDLEANDSNALDVAISKTVERSKLPPGEVPLRVRTNSKGDTTFILRATEDEVWTKQQNMLSKARRNLILQVVPGDIVAEARTRIKAIRMGDIAKDPEGARKKVADAFAALGVMPAQLKDYLGHELSACSPSELVDLRGLYAAIKEGETSWAEAMQGRTGDEPKGQKIEDTKARVAAKAETVVAKPVEPEPVEHPGGVKKDAPEPQPAPVEREPGIDDDEDQPANKAECFHETLHGKTPKGGSLVVCPDCGKELTATMLRSAEGRFAAARGDR